MWKHEGGSIAQHITVAMVCWISGGLLNLRSGSISSILRRVMEINLDTEVRVAT